MENVSKCFCHTCNEDTPHHEETAGRRCEVCFNYADPLQWSTDVDDRWLADFWRAKYFRKGFSRIDFGSGESRTILIHAGFAPDPTILGHLPQDHAVIAMVDSTVPHLSPPVKMAARELPEPIAVAEKYFPTAKSKYHK